MPPRKKLVEAVKDYFYYSFTGRLADDRMDDRRTRHGAALPNWEADSPLNGRDCHFVHHAVFKVFFHFIDLVEPHIKQMVAEYMKANSNLRFRKAVCKPDSADKSKGDFR